MHVERSLHRDRSDRRLPAVILVRQRAHAGRPRELFRLRIRSRDDARLARRAGLPVHLVTPEDTAAFGYAMTFPPRLVTARSLAGLVDTPYRVHPMESERDTLHPRLEDLVVVMLKIDPFAARAIALRNPEFIDPVRLLRRALQEGVEREATLVRLQEVCPGLPAVGESLPLNGLQTQDQNNTSAGAL